MLSSDYYLYLKIFSTACIIFFFILDAVLLIYHLFFSITRIPMVDVINHKPPNER